MCFSKWKTRMVPYIISINFSSLVFIHLNFHCWEANNIYNLWIVWNFIFLHSFLLPT
jgi:hypothetical protein